MHPFLVFIIGTTTGVALKYLWDKYKCIDDSQENQTSRTPINFFENVESSIDIEKFYLRSISALFEKYKVDINEIGAFGKLCNKIRHNIRIDLLELFSNQTTIQDLLLVYQNESIKPFKISFNIAESGVCVSNNYLTDEIKILGLSVDKNFSSTQKVELILQAYYAKGIEAILNNYGKKFEKLELLFTTNDSSLDKYYNILKEDLAFDLKLLKK